MKGILAIGGLLIAGFFGLSIVFGSWYTIDQGYRGVLTRNGAVIGMADPGLGFKMPIIDGVTEISVQENVRNYGNASENSGLNSYSRDQQPAILRVSVNYRIDASKVKDVYSVYGGEMGVLTRILDPRVNKEVRNVFGQFTAVTAVQERARFNREILDALRKSLGDDAPLVITGIQVENIDFDDSYEGVIKDRMKAEVEVQRQKQELEQKKIQAEVTVVQAKAQAEATLAKAQADAQAVRVNGEAAADAIRAKGAALRDNPLLIDLTRAEKWNGSLPTTMVPNSTVPFLDVRPQEQIGK